ncbi:hypothetical protein NUW58_g2421 [Xylaria curta]|uniref:Uncharacterized protein n=1 Tax=Xylaria curta TaxID=42375 RepID=A0ACC1PIG7_9PEZI|nr:hypothetical protein NUW58_g2421 [Xylaria curta]
MATYQYRGFGQEQSRSISLAVVVLGAPHPRFFDPLGARPRRSMMTKQEYNIYVDVHNFVQLNIGDPSHFRNLKKLASNAAKRAGTTAKRLGLTTTNTPDFDKLMLYDFVILCDDSSSMHRDNRVQDLKTTLEEIAKIVNSIGFDRSGITIRFLNYPEDATGEFNNLTNLDEISKQVDKAYQRKRRGSELGGKLQSKVIEPFIKKPIDNGKFEKPIIVVMISDGQSTDENENTLKDVIKDCKKFLDDKQYRKGSVIFLLSQIGNSNTATELLEGVRNDEEIRDMVYCSPHRLDEMIRKPQGESPPQYNPMMLWSSKLCGLLAIGSP